MVILAQKAAFGAKLVAAGRAPAGITAHPESPPFQKKGSGIDLRGLLLLHNVIR
jgi:hypothetical protein